MIPARKKQTHELYQVIVSKMEKIWKDIPWYEWLYQASTDWDIKSLMSQRGHKREKILHPIRHNSWYIRYCISKNGKKYIFWHKLVLLAFLWDSLLEVNHKNGIKTDNRLENLEYCTRGDNIRHSYRSLKRYSYFKENNPNPNKWKFWIHNTNSKKVIQLLKDGSIIKVWHSIADIVRDIWLNQSVISKACKNGKIAYWFIWKFK